MAHTPSNPSHEALQQVISDRVVQVSPYLWT